MTVSRQAPNSVAAVALAVFNAASHSLSSHPEHSSLALNTAYLLAVLTRSQLGKALFLDILPALPMMLRRYDGDTASLLTGVRDALQFEPDGQRAKVWMLSNLPVSFQLSCKPGPGQWITQIAPAPRVPTCRYRRPQSANCIGYPFMPVDPMSTSAVWQLSPCPRKKSYSVLPYFQSCYPREHCSCGGIDKDPTS